MANFVNTEKIKTIAYLGKSGSFTEIAKDYFCEKYNLNAYQMPFRTIKEIIAYVENDKDSVGIIPVENAKEGIIRETNDSLISSTNEQIKILSDAIKDFVEKQKMENYRLKEEISILEKEKTEIQQGIYDALGYLNKLEKVVGVKSKTYTYYYDQTMSESELSSKFIIKDEDI